MRVLFAVASIALGFAGVTAASAADLPTERPESYSTGTYAIGQRTAQFVIYDYRPGVVVRAYWLAPWRHRHYYPTAGEKPEIGRDEDPSAPSTASEPPESFYRSWSASSVFLREEPRGHQPPQIPGPLK
jgi:hypothetical protein